MKFLRYLIIILSLISVSHQNSFAEDTYYVAQKTTLPFTIDGIANETAWDSAVWYPMKYVWIPYNANVDSSDFTGRLKLSWTSERLYLLVEIVDDSLSDKYASPLDNYYNDDCVEVFLDENKSGGNHNDASNAFNAFAMHVSTLFDVVDNGKSGTALFNDLITADLTKSDSLYIWELEIKVYSDTYNPTSPGDPLILTPNKVMGFSLAYCDNDGGSTRENFLASTYVTEANSNNSWLNASIFGSLKLVDSSYTAPSGVNIESEIVPFKVYPNPAHDKLYYSVNENGGYPENIRFTNISGQVVFESKINNNSATGFISVNDLERGVYLVEVVTNQASYSRQIVLY
jgi:hypothetical protein